MIKQIINKIPSQFPNILTISRLLVIPFFLLMVVYQSNSARIFFLILFTYASVTDFLDGYLAREYGVSSNFGKIFDSIADKALILVVCVVVLVRDYFNVHILLIPIIIILVRELIIAGIREVLAEQNIKIHTTKLAKYKTTIQMVALGFLILGSNNNTFYYLVNLTGFILIYIAAIITIVTGLQYLKVLYTNSKEAKAL